MSGRVCWLESANSVETDFPLENLPYGAFTLPGGAEHIGCAIGDQILDLNAATEAGLLATLPQAVREACVQPRLNALMELGAAPAHGLRERVQGMLGDAGEGERTQRTLVPQAQARMRLPAAIGDYTDFYASIHHATNVGRLFRPDNPLMPNYKYMPVGYHGRSSSIVVSGEPIRRPNGQRPGAGGAAPDFGPCRQLDYELEVGAFIGKANRLGTPIPLAQAEDHILGLCLLNDWSARDIQRWEYQPLGPFLGKNFATSISPWIIPMEALMPFRQARAARAPGDPEVLPYLDGAADREHGAVNVTLEVWLATAAMCAAGAGPVRLSQSNLATLYWTLGQMITHHSCNGCNLRPGDLLGTGTVSGPEPGARGCLLELTSAGREPISMPDGESRTFLQDGDDITLKAWCRTADGQRLGWGECRGTIEPALHL
ncbi:MAG: fumarylacetoacetase [Terriglobales bacterium]